MIRSLFILFSSALCCFSQLVIGNQIVADTNVALMVANTNWLNFGTNLTGTTNDLTVWITNKGTATLSGSASTASPFSLVGITSYSITTNDATNIVVRATRSGAANHTNELALTGGGGTNIHLSAVSTNAPSSGWTPSGADYLAAWYKGADYNSGTGTLTDSGPSGWNLIQPTSSSRPSTATLNSLNVVSFDGSDDYLFNASLVTPSDGNGGIYTAIILLKLDEYAANFADYQMSGTNSGNKLRISNGYGNATAGTAVAIGDTLTNQWYVITILGGGSGTVWTNNVQAGTGGNEEAPAGLVWGARHGFDMQSKVLIAEQIYYSNRISSDWMTTNYVYLTNKYGLQ